MFKGVVSFLDVPKMWQNERLQQKQFLTSSAELLHVQTNWI
jgi:hypothetical protein